MALPRDSHPFLLLRDPTLTGHYRGGVALTVSCRACGITRAVDGPPVSRIGLELVNLSDARVGTAITADDLTMLRRDNDANDRGQSVGLVARRYAAACGGRAPPVQALRQLLYADRAVETFPLGMLRGGLLPCLACGEGVRRVYVDGNFSIPCVDHGGAVISYSKPGGLMLPAATAREIEASSRSAQVEAGGSGGGNCGGADWLAASDKQRANTPLAFTGAMVVCCDHEHALLAAPCTRGELKAFHVFIVIWACLIGCLIIILDVYCRDLAHIRVQSAADLGWADRLLQALVGEGSARSPHLPSSTRFIVPGPGSGPNPLVTISIQRNDNAHEAALAAAARGSAVVATSSSAPLTGLPRNSAPEGVLAVLQDMLLFAVVVAVATGSAWGRVAKVGGGIPPLHEYAHGCKHTHGAASLAGSGWLGEVIEQLNRSLSLLSGLVYSMNPTNWLLTLESRLVVHNQQGHAKLPERLVRMYINIRLRLQQHSSAFAALLDNAAAWNDGVQPTMEQIRAWATERSQQAEEPQGELSPNDLRASLLSKWYALRERRTLLAGAIETAELLAAPGPRRTKHQRTSAGGQAEPAASASVVFLSAVASSVALRALVSAKPKKGELPITDAESARARLVVMDARIAAAEKKIGRGASIDVDHRLVAAMRQLRHHADAAAQLRPPPGTNAAIRASAAARSAAVRCSASHTTVQYPSPRTHTPPLARRDAPREQRAPDSARVARETPQGRSRRGVCAAVVFCRR